MENKKYIDPKVLKGGEMLVTFKKNFIENKTTENLYPFLGCLRDSVIILPFTPVDKSRMRPDVLMTPAGDAYLPVFSQPAQIPDDYKGLFSFMPVPTLQCIETAKSMKNLKGLVLDPYTHGVFITYDMTDIIERMESRLKPE